MKRLTDTRPFGTTGLTVPPIVFGTSCLGHLFQAIPYDSKLAIAAEWFKYVQPPVVLDTAGKYGAGLALEMIGKTLSELGIAPEDVIISNKLGWKRIPLIGKKSTFEPGLWFDIDHDAEPCISYDGILECWEQGCNLLGNRYKPQIVSVHDPDEFLAKAKDPEDYRRRFDDVLGAYRALYELKASGEVAAVGVGSKDWKTIRSIAEVVQLDWVMFACSLTIYTHPHELLDFMAELHRAKVATINSAVFNAGFLVGGPYFNYRQPDPDNEPELFGWRESFMEVCQDHEVEPFAACVQFGMSVPGIVGVALNTTRPERVKDNVRAFTTEIPDSFWTAMKAEKLIVTDYPYLG